MKLVKENHRRDRDNASGTWVSFDASGSYDPDGGIVSYTWDFGDGNWETTSEPWTSHDYGSGGRLLGDADRHRQRGGDRFHLGYRQPLRILLLIPLGDGGDHPLGRQGRRFLREGGRVVAEIRRRDQAGFVRGIRNLEG